MVETKGVYHIGIPVDDPDRAQRFYTEVLGMQVVSVQRDDMGDKLARIELRTGDDIVVLFERPKRLDKDAIKEDGATHQAFMVEDDDFDLAVNKMSQWGVKIHNVPTVERPSGRGLYFFDSEGNLLQLYARPKRG